MAGTAQMVALDVWAQPLPLIALAVSVFVAKLRYFVMGAALQPHLPHLSWPMQVPVWYATVDQNWAVNIAEYRRGRGDLGKFLGGGFTMTCIWSGSRLWQAICRLAACCRIPRCSNVWDWILSPRRFSSWSGHSSFAESAMWHPGRWRSPPHSLPNGRSAAIGNWYIVIGGAAGGLYGAWRDVR
jgi:hypothetical protein